MREALLAGGNSLGCKIGNTPTRTSSMVQARSWGISEKPEEMSAQVERHSSAGTVQGRARDLNCSCKWGAVRPGEPAGGFLEDTQRTKVHRNVLMRREPTSPRNQWGLSSREQGCDGRRRVTGAGSPKAMGTVGP